MIKQINLYLCLKKHYQEKNKGNEAWKVYACRFHYAAKPMVWKHNEEELHKRNEAFTAITRSRLWCVITGLEDPVFNEIRSVLNDYPYLSFPAFNQKTIARNNDEEIMINENDGQEVLPGF